METRIDRFFSRMGQAIAIIMVIAGLLAILRVEIGFARLSATIAERAEMEREAATVAYCDSLEAAQE